MSHRQFWGLFCLVFFVGLSALDFAFFLCYGSDGTLSGVIRWANSQWPLLSSLLSFTAGALYGHFFLSLRAK